MKLTRRPIFVLAAVLAALAFPAVASADLAHEEQQGQRIAEAVRAAPPGAGSDRSPE